MSEFIAYRVRIVEETAGTWVAEFMDRATGEVKGEITVHAQDKSHAAEFVRGYCMAFYRMSSAVIF